MNILQLSPRIPAPLRDGGAVYIYHTTKNLAESGHNMIMAAFESNNHEQDAGLMKPWCRLYSAPGNFKPYTIPAVVQSTVLRKPISIYHRMNREIMEGILEKIKDPVDVILLEGIHCAWFIGLLRKHYPGKKIVLRQSNVEHLLLSRNGSAAGNPFIKLFYKDQARLMRRFEKKAMKEVDAVTAISAEDEGWYLKDVPGLKTKVVSAGAELPEISYNRRENNVLVAISNWRWQPNMDGLVWFLNEIWPDLKKEHPDLRFEVIGDGIPELLRKKKDGGGIEFLGFVEDVEPYRQQATMLVAPLLSGSGVKLKVLEAMASGTPVITTFYGAEGIEIKDRIHYLHADGAPAFKDAVHQLLKDKSLRESLSVNSRKLIREKYSWEAQTRKLNDFLKEINT